MENKEYAFAIDFVIQTFGGIAGLVIVKCDAGGEKNHGERAGGQKFTVSQTVENPGEIATSVVIISQIQMTTFFPCDFFGN